MGHFTMRITNHTDRTLHNVSKHKYHGKWVKQPMAVPANSSMEAVHIETKPLTGYQFETVWQLEGDSKDYISLNVHVPHDAHHCSGTLTSGGDLIVEGWKDIPKDVGKQKDLSRDVNISIIG